jgi:hypothetical protein
MALSVENEKQRYKAYILRLAGQAPAEDLRTKLAIYDKLRAANEQMIRNNSATIGAERASVLRAALEEAIREHNAGGEPATTIPDPRQPYEVPDDPVALPPLKQGVASFHAAPEPKARPRKGRWLVLGGILGILLTAAVLAALYSLKLVGFSIGREAVQRQALVEQRYREGLSDIDPAMAFMRRVEQEIQRRQKTGAAALAAIAGGGFKALSAIDPDLAKQQPALPGGNPMIVQADAKGYKLLYSSPLCTTARFARPELVDPVHDFKGLGCYYFGLWNEAGSKF